MRKLALITAVGYTIALTFLSLTNLGSVASEVPEHTDKLAHLFAYALLTVLWAFTLGYGKENKTKPFLIAGGFALIFGTVIEVIQGELTTVRSTELYDVFANTLGILIGFAIMCVKYNRRVKKWQ